MTPPRRKVTHMSAAAADQQAPVKLSPGSATPPLPRGQPTPTSTSADPRTPAQQSRHRHARTTTRPRRRAKRASLHQEHRGRLVAHANSTAANTSTTIPGPPPRRPTSPRQAQGQEVAPLRCSHRTTRRQDRSRKPPLSARIRPRPARSGNGQPSRRPPSLHQGPAQPHQAEPETNRGVASAEIQSSKPSHTDPLPWGRPERHQAQPPRRPRGHSGRPSAATKPGPPPKIQHSDRAITGRESPAVAVRCAGLARPRHSVAARGWRRGGVVGCGGGVGLHPSRPGRRRGGREGMSKVPSFNGTFIFQI
nr:serine/arginine repetitive matrix protein 1-like [Aegilops tauschii subsp. strangulata]